MTRVYVAANRGDIGGGEVMLLRLATALAELGYDVTAVVPSTPSHLASEARAAGLVVEVISCHDRPSYARALRRWDTDRKSGVLWCNGLLPAMATAGRHRRVVHLHQMPVGVKRRIARIARVGAEAVVVPSQYLADRLAPAEVLPNWTDRPLPGRRREDADQVSVGFIGRVGLEKGVHVLAAACAMLDPAVRSRVRLVIAGDDRFVPSADRRTVHAALASSGVRVEQTGWIAPQEFFAGVDLAVVPSVRAESFGLVAAEAMAASCPVVVSDAGALAEVVGPGYPWVFRAGDAAALSRILAAAIAALPAEDLARAQRERWEAEYSPVAGRRHLQALVGRLVGLGALEAPVPR